MITTASLILPTILLIFTTLRSTNLIANFIRYKSYKIFLLKFSELEYRLIHVLLIIGMIFYIPNLNSNYSEYNGTLIFPITVLLLAGILAHFAVAQEKYMYYICIIWLGFLGSLVNNLTNSFNTSLHIINLITITLFLPYLITSTTYSLVQQWQLNNSKRSSREKKSVRKLINNGEEFTSSDWIWFTVITSMALALTAIDISFTSVWISTLLCGQYVKYFTFNYRQNEL